MKKITFCFTLCLFCSLSFLQAHDLWVNAKYDDSRAKAQIGFGHDFPKAKPISEKGLLVLSQGMTLHGININEKLIKSKDGANYEYESKGELKKGSYIVSTSGNPTTWSQNAEGWKPVDKTALKDPISCSRFTMLAKAPLNVGKISDMSLLSKPIGHTLEIVPVGDPFKIETDDPVKFKVLFEGKPLKYATLTGAPEGFADGHKAFSGTTNLKGEINVTFLKEGKWMLHVTHDVDFLDQSICDQDTYNASFVVDVR